jgi:hypothetical protein
MNQRARSVVLGLGLGVAPILLLDLAGTLRGSVASDPSGTSFWWVVACYAGTGALSAFGLMAGARDRLLAGVALVILLIGVVPWIPVAGLSQLSQLPLVPFGSGGMDAIGVGFALAGAYTYVLVQGNRT